MVHILYILTLFYIVIYLKEVKYRNVKESTNYYKLQIIKIYIEFALYKKMFNIIKLIDENNPKKVYLKSGDLSTILGPYK